MRGLFATLALSWLLVACLADGAAAAARALGPAACGKNGVVCSRVSVPLDSSGRTPGRLSLQVEVRRAKGRARGVMFLMAGGPGQASTHYFDLGPYGYWSLLFRDYTLVTFDPRGTGDSDPLSCRANGIMTAAAERAASIAADCARQLGPARAFFATRDNVSDIEAIRRALGFRRISLYGASYGTDLALAYARSYPTRVQRLVLDSVASPLTSLPVEAEVLRQIPSTLRRFCDGVCDTITADYARDVVSLANSLAVKPLQGRVVQVDGGLRTRRLDAMRFLTLVVESDVDPGLAAELPAAVHAARRGNARPLLRLAQLVESNPEVNALGPVYTATSCDDGPFPWRSDTPIAQRPSLLKSALGHFTSGAFGGFGAWAAPAAGNAWMCLEWPVSPPRELRSNAPYPDVPVLAISGALDLRSPTIEARGLLTHFPHGHLVTVRNAGHSALASSPSLCLLEAVRSWIRGKDVPRSCHNPRLLAPLAPFTAERTGLARKPLTAATLALVTKTLAEAEATWMLAAAERTSRVLPGLAAGRLTMTPGGFTLSRYSSTAGLGLNGELSVEFSGVRPIRLHGIVRVKRGAATIGVLAVNGNALDGRLDGATIVAGRPSSPAPPAGAGGSAGEWAAWAPQPGSTAEVAAAIASHVAGEYRLDEAGTPLLAAGSGPATSRSDKKRSVLALAVERVPYASSTAEFHLAQNTWSYVLCGAHARCSIGGEASSTRGRLVRREALELALYTFKYEPDLSSLLVYIPPPPGADPSTVLYFERSDLAAALAQPLAKTLTLAAPPLPSDPDTSEREKIDLLTLPHMFTYDTTSLQGGGIELKLTPLD